MKFLNKQLYGSSKKAKLLTNLKNPVPFKVTVNKEVFKLYSYLFRSGIFSSVFTFHFLLLLFICFFQHVFASWFLLLSLHHAHHLIRNTVEAWNSLCNHDCLCHLLVHLSSVVVGGLSVVFYDAPPSIAHMSIRDINPCCNEDAHSILDVERLSECQNFLGALRKCQLSIVFRACNLPPLGTLCT